MFFLLFLDDITIPLPYTPQDMLVVCGDGCSVSTSSLLLAAISPWLRSLMEEAGHGQEVNILLNCPLPPIALLLCFPSFRGRGIGGGGGTMGHMIALPCHNKFN